MDTPPSPPLGYGHDCWTAERNHRHRTPRDQPVASRACGVLPHRRLVGDGHLARRRVAAEPHHRRDTAGHQTHQPGAAGALAEASPDRRDCRRHRADYRVQPTAALASPASGVLPVRGLVGQRGLAGTGVPGVPVDSRPAAGGLDVRQTPLRGLALQVLTLPAGDTADTRKRRSSLPTRGRGCPCPSRTVATDETAIANPPHGYRRCRSPC